MSERRNGITGRTFGLGAGLAYGISAVLIRRSVGDLAPPLVGAAIAMAAGSLGLFVLGGRGVKSSLVESKKTVAQVLDAAGTNLTEFALIEVGKA